MIMYKRTSVSRSKNISINKIQADIKTITEYIQNLIKQKHEVETLKTKIII